MKFPKHFEWLFVDPLLLRMDQLSVIPGAPRNIMRTQIPPFIPRIDDCPQSVQHLFVAHIIWNRRREYLQDAGVILDDQFSDLCQLDAI